MKQYQGEKAIISLTSWRARIGTVGKTIFNLHKMCPGFHIVLCLSEEEFPRKEAELPENLMLLADANLFEILWVYKNYKTFKKVLFTIDKYRDVPVISADDDCLYTCNYAEELYRIWSFHKSSVITYKKQKKCTQGPCTLYPPCFIVKDEFINGIEKEIAANNFSDDAYYYSVIKQKNIDINYVHENKFPYVFHTDKCSLHNYHNHPVLRNLFF